MDQLGVDIRAPDARDSREYWKLLSINIVRKIPHKNNTNVTGFTDIPAPLNSDFSEVSFLFCLKCVSKFLIVQRKMLVG